MADALEYEFPILGLDSVDRAHRALLDMLAELAKACDQEFAGRYPALVATIERDFREEEALMDAVGLPSFQAHLEQHARMLSALHHAASHVQEGNLEPGREAVILLPQWLFFHISTMDKSLIDALQQCGQTGATSSAGE